jgi:hypothetical protein
MKPFKKILRAARGAVFWRVTQKNLLPLAGYSAR